MEIESAPLALGEDFTYDPNAPIRESIARAASYTVQSLVIACGTGRPRVLSLPYDEVPVIERYIQQKLCELNGV